MQTQALTATVTPKHEKLEIYPKFRDLLPPLTATARRNLKLSIKRNGIIEPICYRVKDGQKQIIDGHNRYEAAGELNIKFETREVSLHCPLDEAYMYWMLEKQAGRRDGRCDVNAMERCLEAIHKWQGKASTKADRIAQIAGVTGKTEAAVKKGIQRGRSETDTPSPTKDEKPVVDPMEYAIKALARILATLDSEQKRVLAQHIQASIDT